MADTKLCPFCAEEIRAQAVRCRYCRSRLLSFDHERWHRNYPERRLAGVCAALAHMLSLPLSLIRLTFLVFTFFLHFAPLVYAALWLVIPKRPGEQSPLEWLLETALGVVRGHSAPDESAVVLRREERSDLNGESDVVRHVS